MAIARALYRDAAIWIFDEATSALDSESEIYIQKAIETLSHRKTILVIAHRLSTIKNADSICVISDGCVVEQGTHDHLMAMQGRYAEMINIQSGMT